jgi:hypothetical protein
VYALYFISNDRGRADGLAICYDCNTLLRSIQFAFTPRTITIRCRLLLYLIVKNVYVCKPLFEIQGSQTSWSWVRTACFNINGDQLSAYLIFIAFKTKIMCTMK